MGFGVMANVFISYRRSDSTWGYASWIHDRLADRFGPDHIFMDVDSVPLGADFVDHIDRAMADADIALILIGPRWVGATDEAGERRLDDPEDFVRIEITAALRSKSSVIPVLVDGAQMPTRKELPDELWPLTRRQALIFQRHGNAAIQELLAAVERVEREREARLAAERKREADEQAREEAKEKARREAGEEARLVLGALESSRNVSQGYRTLVGLARATGLSEAAVKRVIDRSPSLVVKSRIPDRNGAALFKLRD